MVIGNIGTNIGVIGTNIMYCFNKKNYIKKIIIFTNYL